MIVGGPMERLTGSESFGSGSEYLAVSITNPLVLKWPIKR